jgi:hypothetical protein
MQAMKPMIDGLGPMMQQAQTMMKGMGDGNGGMESLMAMASKMGIGEKKQ